MAWKTGWAYRKKLTIDNTKIDSTLTNYPVLVKITNTRLPASHLQDQTDAYDVVFTAVDGTTLLKHERVWYDGATDTGEWWVKIPSISSSADTEFYMYYCKSGQSDTSSTDTWNANYRAVHHFQTLNDSTVNNYDGTNNGGTQVDALIGKGYSLTDHNITFGVTAGDFGTGPFTVQILLKTTDSSNLVIFGNADGSSYGWEAWHASADDKLYFNIQDSVVQRVCSGVNTTYRDDDWHIVTIASDDSTHDIYIYVDTTLVASYSGTAPWPNVNTDANTIIGALIGTIDEFRMLTTAFGGVTALSHWIKADVNSLNDTLITYGTEEGNPLVESVSDAPDPVLLGANITFDVNWDWWRNVDIRICKTDSLTNGVCDGGEWTSLLDTGTDPVDVVYGTESVGSKNYYAFVCDHIDPTIASTSTAGTFDVNIGNIYAHFEQHRGNSSSVTTFTTGTNCSNVERREDVESVRNKIQVLGNIGIKSAIQEDSDSQNSYGLRELTYTDRSIESVADANKLALNLLAKLKDPLEVLRLTIISRTFLEVIGDVITVNDINSGLSNAEYRIIEIIRDFSDGMDKLIYECVKV